MNSKLTTAKESNTRIFLPNVPSTAILALKRHGDGRILKTPPLEHIGTRSMNRGLYDNKATSCGISLDLLDGTSSITIGKIFLATPQLAIRRSNVARMRCAIPGQQGTRYGSAAVEAGGARGTRAVSFGLQEVQSKYPRGRSPQVR